MNRGDGMDPQIDLSIIIVNWRSVDYLRSCIRSIVAEAQSPRYEIVVVDNASNDGCGEVLAREFPDVVFIQSKNNLGFSGANNLGAQQARGHTLLFLNPDTEILNHAIDALYRESQNLPNLGILGCRLLNTDRSLQTTSIQAFPTILNQLLSADLLKRAFPKSRLWGMAPLYDSSLNIAEVEFVSGACMMMRRLAFERVGGFSTDYFMYAEDADLCYKARSASLTNYYFPKATVIHHGGRSTTRASNTFADVMMREAVGRFFRKHRGVFYTGVYRLALSIAALGRLSLLALTLPGWLIVRNMRLWSATCRKWVSILWWGMGLASWTRSYR